MWSGIGEQGAKAQTAAGRGAMDGGDDDGAGVAVSIERLGGVGDLANQIVVEEAMRGTVEFDRSNMTVARYEEIIR